MDTLHNQDISEQDLKTLVEMLKLESMRAQTASQGYAMLLKRMIKNGQRPTDEQIIQMMDAILESNRAYRVFMEEVNNTFPTDLPSNL